MPVELDAFTALRLAQGTVRVQWKTYTETNTARFTVLRSAELPYRWEEVGYLPAQGNSRQQQYYSFTDEATPTGPSLYYRLRVEDFDGSVQYSPVAAVCGLEEVVQAFPNPFSDRLHIRTPATGSWRVSLIDGLGRTVLTQWADRELITLSVGELPGGVYTALFEQHGVRRLYRLYKR
jgi:hypothetical protein